MAKAAKDLGLVRRTVSRQICSLEEELGTALLVRDGPHFTLSTAGQSLYRHALPWVNRMERLPDFLAEGWRGVRSDKVRLAAGRTAATLIVPAAFERFQTRNPDAEPLVKIGTTAERREWLRNYEVDLTFERKDVLDPQEADDRPLTAQGFVFITPLDHPLAGRESVGAGEMASHPMVLPTRDTPAGQWVAHFARCLGVEISTAVEVDDWTLAARYVEAGVGVALVPELCLEDEVQVSKSRTTWPADRQTYVIATRPGEPLPPLAGRFVESIAS